MKRIPYDQMPDDIEIKLTKMDYMYALLHPAGVRRGLFEVIHMNVNYPEWHNVIIPPNTLDCVIIYTGDGWKYVSFETVWDQFNFEYISCVSYLYKNKNILFPLSDNKIDLRYDSGNKSLEGERPIPLKGSPSFEKTNIKKKIK